MSLKVPICKKKRRFNQKGKGPWVDVESHVGLAPSMTKVSELDQNRAQVLAGMCTF